ncbi:MAG: hypothetical protein KH349_00195 [Clostridium sp.]|nr:hypothetical protein [Clostridium sp.]
MHSTIIEDYENRQDLSFEINSKKQTFLFLLTSIFVTVSLGVIAEFVKRLTQIPINIHSTFFISSIVFYFFSFMNIVNIVFKFKEYHLMRKDTYAIIILQYIYELKKLQLDKTSKDMVDKVIFELHKKHIYFKNDLDSFLIVKNLAFAKFDIDSLLVKKKDVSKLLWEFCATIISIVITLLLANNLSKEFLCFGSIVFLCLTITFLLIVIIPNPIYKKRKCKKLAEKTELIMRLNEEIEIQERKILNKE